MLSLVARLAVALRARVGLLVLAVLSISYAIAAGCIVMLTAAILLLRKGPSAPPKDETAPAPWRASVVLADAINDVHAIPFPASLRPTTASASGEVHREPLEIGERAVVEGAFVCSSQDHAGRLVRLERFLPAFRTQAPASPGLRPGKPNCCIGVERSLPRDLARNSAVMTAQTV